MKKQNLVRLLLVTVLAGAISIPALASHSLLSSEYLLLHSRDPDPDPDPNPRTPTPYFSSAEAYGNTIDASSVGGNTASGGAFYTTSLWGISGVRSGAFALDSTSLGITLNDPYEVALTWGAQPSLRVARVTVTHATGTDTILVDQGATNNEWVALGTYAFSGAPGEEIRIWNDGIPDGGVVGNIQYDSVQLTQIPEPGAYAAIFAGLTLLGALVYRCRRPVKAFILDPR